MSVAENPVAERAPRSPQQRLALGSFVGAIFVLAALWLIFGGIPALWDLAVEALTNRMNANLASGQPQYYINEFLSSALLIVIELLAIAGVVFLGHRLMRHQTEPGLRAGIVVAAILMFVSIWIGFAIGRAIEPSMAAAVGTGVWVGVTVALIAGVVYLLMTRPMSNFLEGVEEQGWFTLAPYKGNQGVRVRRATVLGVLVLGFCGIITLVRHGSFGGDRAGPVANNWAWLVPYTSYRFSAEKVLDNLRDGRPISAEDAEALRGLVQADRLNQFDPLLTDANPDALIAFLGGQAQASYNMARYVPLMFSVHVVMPLVLSVVLLWFAYRLVNFPVFADFLIATEAEMNKVSWTTRRRLFQDTIVVLVTVLLMTVFLFVVDIIWIRALSMTGVLQVDLKTQLQKQQEKTQW